MANIITFCRILISTALLFCPAMSSVFYVLYCLAGFTDMIDGPVARKTNTACGFGRKADTVADIIFVAVCLIKLLPYLAIPVWLRIWIGVIAAIKIANMIGGYIYRRKFTAEHTIMNKITGATLFVFPLTISVVDVKYSGTVICIIATLAAVQEGHLVKTKTRKSYI